MDSHVSNSKFKILFINIFTILYKAATLNFYQLKTELREIELVLGNSSNDLVLPRLLILLISLLLIAKFFFGYVSLAANVIAIFPILSDEQPELLLPTIVSQAIENILLSLIEILLGYITCKYYLPGKLSIFVIFIVKMVFKMSLSISTLNVYSDLYSQLKFPPLYKKSKRFNEASEEFIQKRALT